uniref:Uncharacterized protein n=1 Tax=Accipiter nisus TaxID=211598 RepID=A0A8B9MIL9_9AVES
MSHEKCLKNVKIPCSCIAPSLVRVPVAHCFGPPGHYKRKFCTVCRKSLESPAFRCEGNLKNSACIAICVLSSNVYFACLAYLGCMCVHTHTHTHARTHLLCLRDFWVVYHPLFGHGNVYFKLRNNKSITFNKPQTLSDMYALSSFLQFTLSKSVVLVCNESMPKMCKE